MLFRSLSSRRSASGKDELTAMREQIVGLKVIIATLTEENQQMADRNKALMNESLELKCVLLTLRVPIAADFWSQGRSTIARSHRQQVRSILLELSSPLLTLFPAA